MRPSLLISVLCYNKNKYAFFNSTLINNLIISPKLIFFYIKLLKLSNLSVFSFFHGLFFFESISINSSIVLKKNNLSYTFMTKSGLDIISLNLTNSTITSCESLYFSLRWQEREAMEFLNFNFLKKVDKRSLYLTPNFGLYPLNKDFPSIGFFEISLNSVMGLSYNRVFLK